MNTTTLKDTAWLAQRLNISETTIERLRARGSSDLPPHLTIGRSIRYDPDVVEFWCSQRLQVQSASMGDQK
ncbi:helix-turn-helix domain-containing protein [bacterium]|nr:helix-turn-helix domain-containing protein [bacterium]